MRIKEVTFSSISEVCKILIGVLVSLEVSTKLDGARLRCTTDLPFLCLLELTRVTPQKKTASRPKPS